MDDYYRYITPHGTFTIRRRNERWHAMLDDESLGAYLTAQQALDDLCGGHTFSPSSGVDTSGCGLPDTLAEWEAVRVE